MGHVDHPDLALAQDAQDLEEALAGPGLEGGRGLVEQQDSRLGHKGFGDLDQLAFGQRELADLGVYGPLDPQLLEHGSGQLPHAPTIDERTASWFPHGEEVVEDVEVRKEAQLLGHHGDAVRDGVGRVVEPNLGAIEAHGARVRSDRAGHDLDQRGLPGSILTQQRVHAAGTDGEVGAVECHDAPVRLADALRLEGGHRESVPGAISSAARC